MQSLTHKICSFQDGFSDLIKEWNELRGRAVQKAVEDILFEELQKELRERLLRESYEYVIKVTAVLKRNIPAVL